MRPRSHRPAKRQRTRRLRPETLETRRVMAAAIDLCVPIATVDLPDAPAHEWHAGRGNYGRHDAHMVVKPFKIIGGGTASKGLPLVPGLSGPHSSVGIATKLGRHTGAGEFTLDTIEIFPTGEVTGTFHGS